MKENKVFNTGLSDVFKNTCTKLIHNFSTIEGGVGTRNVIKIVTVEGEDLNIKAFKIPNIVNQIAYGFFRKSKARRSFERISTLFLI